MQNSAPKKPPPRRRWRVLWATLAFVLLPLLLGVVLRLYYNDARIAAMGRQALQERLRTSVEISGLTLSAWDGVELTGLRIGPLPGFLHDTLRIQRLAAHWQASALLSGALVLPEVACTGVHAALEENAHGNNLEAAVQALRGPPSPAAQSPAAQAPARQGGPAPQGPPRPLRLPVPVRLERLTMALDEVLVDRPNQRGRLARIQAEGHLEGDGEALSGHLWAGLGDPNGTQPSVLHLETDAPKQSLDVTQTLGVTADTTGFGDIRLGLDWRADAQGQQGAHAVVPTRLEATVRVEANLLGETVNLPRCALRVGDPQSPGASLDLVAAATHLFGTPEVAVQTLQGEARLDALQPLMAPWLPGVQVGGVARARLEPLSASVPALQGWSRLATAATLTTEGLRFAEGARAATGLDSETQVHTQNGIMTVQSHVRLARAAQGDTVAQGLEADLQARTPLAPWLGGDPDGEVPVTAAVRLGKATGPGFEAADTVVEAQVAAPIALLKRAPGDKPLEVTVRGSHRRAGAGTNVLQGLRYTLRLHTWDLAGERADVALHVQASPQLGTGDQALRLASTAVHLDAQRRGDTFLLRELEVSAAPDWKFTLAGAVDDATTDAPHFRALRAAVAPLSIASAIEALPPAKRPAGRFAGVFVLSAALDGTVPYRELLAHSHPPPLPAPDDPAWSQGLQAAADWLQAWVDRLDDGLPFTAQVRLELRDVDAAPTGSDMVVTGLKLVQDFALRKHGPAYRLDVNLPQAGGATPLQGLLFHLEAGIEGGDMALRTDTRVAEVTPAGQTPLQDLRCSGALDYTWGGDLRLHDVLLVAANRGVKLTASGLVAQPLDVAMTRAWTRAGMPGVEGRFAWALGMHASHEERLSQAGMTFGGGLDVNGELRLDQGELALVGELRADHVHMESGTTLVEQMNGALPFDLRLVFGTRDDATPLRRNLGIGGGTLSLVTGDDDVRNRPARPVYYDRLRPYRPGVGLSALRVQSGPYEVVDFALEGRVTEGMLLADWISMHVLGGDVVGNLALQLGRDSAVRADMAFKVSNIDASYLPVLSLKPGPDSELSADMRVSFLAGEQGRDLSANMNVTKIGAKALDRFLQLLDPEAKDAKLQDTRKNLRFVRIQQVAVWMRYENLNMDLSYDPILAIPFTQIGYRPIERELLRRYALGEFLDLYMQPYIDTKLAPALGWTHGHT